MNANDELRSELTKRGVEWWPMHDIEAGYYQDRDTEFVVDGKKYTAHEWGSRLTVYGLTPAQAIAATLGREDTYTREDVEGAFVSGYSLGLDMFDSSKPEKGWNQNERNLDEEMEDLGWVRKDAAALGKETCHDLGGTGANGEQVFNCSECGCVLSLYDRDGSNNLCTSFIFDYPRHCPECGRKVVDE